ncbi:MAG: alpha/beta fold hydrolase [Chrysiogenetes bacterium]|nr:alpha/beta fold hydrolase [Chrysiogenetes bacterium]
MPVPTRQLQFWEVRESAREVLTIETPDGWRLAVSSYSQPRSGGEVVLLCHGLASNRLTFDIDPRYSLAAHLAREGYEVYSLELRGHGLSRPPASSQGPVWGHGIAEHCELDLPAVIDAVLERSGQRALHYIGHSMGGIVLYGAHAVGAVDPGKIKSAIAIAASLDYSGTPSAFHKIVGLAPLSHAIPAVPAKFLLIPLAELSRFFSWARLGSLVNHRNVEMNVYRRLLTLGIHPISSKVLRDLAGAINGRGMLSSQGRPYTELLEERGYDYPVLSMSGCADLQCPHEASGRFGTHEQRFGRTYGHTHDYGHEDLIMGIHAERETWPAIQGWLESNSPTGQV